MRRGHDTAAAPRIGSELVAFAPADELRRMASERPAALIGAEAFAAAVGHAEGLPAIFHWLVLEARLTGEDPSVDLLASVADGDGARARVAAALRGPAVPQLAGAGALLDVWAHRRDPALDDCHVLWCEWDAPFTRPGPLLLLSIDPGFWGPPDRTASPDERVALADAGRRAVFGAAYPADERAAHHRAIAALPAEGRAIAAADFRARGGAYSRLFVGVPRAQVLPWLAAIEWPGDRARAAAWLHRVVAPWERAYLQIELDAATRPYLGIEPEQTRGSGSELRERRRFLDLLVAERRTSSERAGVVLEWPGEQARGDLSVVRSVHLKCVLRPDEEVQVKAYLGLHLRRRG
jgi:hypothetical protein